MLGTLFSNCYSQLRARSERERLAVAARKEAIGAFSRFIYERRVRAEMLASSMRRKASLDELRERKRLYDDAYAVWNTNHQANLFLVREVLQASDYSDFESDVENRLVGEIFRPLDSCLTRAYDARMAEQDPNPILQACSVSDLIQQALDCGYALTNELYKLSSADGDALRGQQQGAESEVSERCP